MLVLPAGVIVSLRLVRQRASADGLQAAMRSLGFEVKNDREAQEDGLRHVDSNSTIDFAEFLAMMCEKDPRDGKMCVLPHHGEAIDVATRSRHRRRGPSKERFLAMMCEKDSRDGTRSSTAS